eukprot:TRINITY_DN3084_c0_g6_i1.p1 TRINITY_DN3084_c0_g6~~TRINITY_DN3084_c0_g6_i1.p1  ORF type:complete len:611 (-),score=135.83 TRINITY_DN3084_c0_g6_i1:54-1886(-)
MSGMSPGYFDLGKLSANSASASFSGLLQQLIEQYERDILETARTVRISLGHPLPVPQADWTDGPSPPLGLPERGFGPPRLPRHGEPVPPPLELPMPNSVFEELPFPRGDAGRKLSRASGQSAGAPGDGNGATAPAPPPDRLRMTAASVEATRGGDSPTPSTPRTASKPRNSYFKEENLPARRRSSAKSSEIPEPLNAVSRFVQSPSFDKISAFLLIANAAFIGVQVQYSFEAVMPFAIEIIDYAFCVCFILELAFRMGAYGCKYFWCAKADRAWNTFDFLIVLVSSFDAVITIASQGGDSPLGNISVLRVIRIVRITRVLRIIRVMKFFQDLRILVSAIASTLKTASFAFLLIFFTIYIFAIAITQLVAEHVKENKLQWDVSEDLFFFFGSIPRSLISLFMTIAGGIDWKDAYEPLYGVSPLALFFFLVYIMLMILCVMNVLTGIFCQSAIDTAASDKETVIQLQLQEKHRFVETLQQMFDKMDDDGRGILVLEDFQNHLQDDTMQAMLKSLEIEVRDAITLFELLDTDASGEVDINEFVTGCITLRGGAKAVHMEKVSNMNKIFTARFDTLESQMLGLTQQLQQMLQQQQQQQQQQRSPLMISHRRSLS